MGREMKGTDGKSYTIRLAGRRGKALEAFWSGEASAQHALAAERGITSGTYRYNVIVTDATGAESVLSNHGRVTEAMAAADAYPREKGNAAIWDRGLGRWVKESEMPWAEILMVEMEGAYYERRG